MRAPESAAARQHHHRRPETGRRPPAASTGAKTPPQHLRAAPPPSPSRAGAVATVVVVVLAAALRLVAVQRSYDLWEDEIDYVVLSTSLSHGNFPPVFPGSGPFLLHPPFFFALGAAWQLLLRPGPHFFATVLDMRILNALLAAATCGCLYALGTKLANRLTGLSAAALFALDPYILRQNGRVFLETNTMLFVLLGCLVLLRVVQHRERRTLPTAVGAGLLLGLAVTSKDMAALLTWLPLAILVASGFGVPRKVSGAVLAASAVPYGVYVASLAAVGSIGAYWAQETSGLGRFFGVHKTTGFTAKGSPSLTHTLLQQAVSYGPTYLLVGASLVGTLYLLVVSRRTDHRIFAVLSGCGALTVLYALLFGTIEEQFLYFLIVPAILSLCVGAHEWARRRRTVFRARRFAAVALGLLVVMLSYDLGLWAHVRTTPDNGQQRLVAWLSRHVPPGAVVDNDSEVTLLTLQIEGIPSVIAPTLAEARAAHVRYFTVLSYESTNRYSSVTLAQERVFERTGRLAWSFHDSTYGYVQVYVSDNPSRW